MAFWDKWFADNKADITKRNQPSPLIDPAVDNLMSGNPALGDLAKVQALLAAGADVNRKDTGGFSPLHVAVMTGNRDTIAALLDMGGKVDFNTVATTPVAEAPVPEAAAGGGDIEIRKPITFKHKA